MDVIRLQIRRRRRRGRFLALGHRTWIRLGDCASTDAIRRSDTFDPKRDRRVSTLRAERPARYFERLLHCLDSVPVSALAQCSSDIAVCDSCVHSSA